MSINSNNRYKNFKNIKKNRSSQRECIRNVILCSLYAMKDNTKENARSSIYTCEPSPSESIDRRQDDWNTLLRLDRAVSTIDDRGGDGDGESAAALDLLLLEPIFLSNANTVTQ